MPFVRMNSYERDLPIDHAKRLAQPFERIVVGWIESIRQASITQKRPRRDSSVRTCVRRNRHFKSQSLIFAFDLLPEEYQFVSGMNRAAE